MAHRLTADSEPDVRAQLFQTVNAESFPGDKDIIILAERRSEIDKLVGIKTDAGHAQRGARENARRAGTDREAIAFCVMIDVVCNLHPASSRHVFRNDGLMPGNVLLQELNHDPVPQVSHTAGIASLHQCNRFALIVRRLADAFLREEKYQDENRARPKVKKFHFTSIHLFVSPRIIDPYATNNYMSI